MHDVQYRMCIAVFISQAASACKDAHVAMRNVCAVNQTVAASSLDIDHDLCISH